VEILAMKSVSLVQNDGKLIELEIDPLETIEGDFGLPVLDGMQKCEWADPSTLKGIKD
jgi:hypothetical protein